MSFAATILPADLQDKAEVIVPGLVGLIEADVMSVSHRMAILEKYLTGERQMKLTTSPNGLSRTLRTDHGIENSEIWVSAYEYYAFAAALSQRLTAGDTEAIKFVRERHDYQMLEDMYQLTRGCYKSLRGQFDDYELELGQELQRGSKTLLMASRLAQEKISVMTTDRNVQEELGYVRPEEMSLSDWQENLRRTKLTFVRSKDMASYFIGMIHMEQGNYADAIDWLEKRTLQIGVEATQSLSAELTPNQPATVEERPSLSLLPGLVTQESTLDINRLEQSNFENSARYNLARCYLAIGEPERAVEILQTVDDASDAGRANARLIKLLQP